jgi:histidinol-phosphatase (PHP family)
MLTDYHIHTPLCHHATGSPRDYVLAAQKAGLDEIGFSDHNPMPTQFDEWRMGPDQLPEYLNLITQVRHEFPDYPIRLGLECDFIAGYEHHVESLAQQAEWDYLIGSVHYITTREGDERKGGAGSPGERWEIDSPRHLKKWKEHPVEEIWQRYFEEYTRMAESNLFDFLAHPDLVKKFGHRPQGDLSRFYKNAIEAIADHGVVLEVSTAGLRKDCKEIYPSRDFLTLAHKKHIPIVINSDAHTPDEVGYAFADAIKLVREVGYDKVTRFEKRKTVSVPLPL